MASATSTLRVVSVPVPTPPKREEGSVVLTLTGPEARTLLTVFGKIGGDMCTARRHTDAVSGALRAAGIKSFAPSLGSGGVTFLQGSLEVADKVPEYAQDCYSRPYGSY